MCVLKTGYLFLASAFGNHYLFTFKGIGIKSTICTFSSRSMISNTKVLTNLQIVDEMSSLAPIIKMKIDNYSTPAM